MTFIALFMTFLVGAFCGGIGFLAFAIHLDARDKKTIAKLKHPSNVDDEFPFNILHYRPSN